MRFGKWGRGCVSWPGWAALALLSMAPLPATTIFSTGFEPPAYTTGQVSGQDGWSGSTTPVVENTTVFAGSQAVAENTTGVSSQVVVDQPLSYNATGQTLVESVEFMEGSGTQPGWLALEAFDSGGLIANVQVNGGNATLGLASSTAGSVPIDNGQWYDFQLVLNYGTQTVSAYVNATLVGSGAFASPGTNLVSVDFGSLPTGGNNATGYWDNLSVATASVPEPSAFFLCLGALPGLALLSRKRRAA